MRCSRGSFPGFTGHNFNLLNRSGSLLCFCVAKLRAVDRVGFGRVGSSALGVVLVSQHYL